MFPVLLAEIGSCYKLMTSLQTKLYLTATLCRYKLETALFAIVERMLDFSHNFRNLKFNEEFHDIVLRTCLLLYFSAVSKASRKSITRIFNEE